jgi:hypothetical protein
VTLGQRVITQVGVTSNRTASVRPTTGGALAVGAADCGVISATADLDAFEESAIATALRSAAEPDALAFAPDRDAFSHSDDTYGITATAAKNSP